MKFWFRTTFQSEIIFLSVGDNLFYHGTHLVYLDGIDDEMLTFIVIFLLSLFKTSRSFLNAIVQNVGKTQEYGSCDVTLCEITHDVAQINLYIIFARTHKGVTFFVNAEIVHTPSFDVVEFF